MNKGKPVLLLVISLDLIWVSFGNEQMCTAQCQAGEYHRNGCICKPCPGGTYTELVNTLKECRRCRSKCTDGTQESVPCRASSNRVCRQVDPIEPGTNGTNTDPCHNRSLLSATGISACVIVLLNLCLWAVYRKGTNVSACTKALCFKSENDYSQPGSGGTVCEAINNTGCLQHDSVGEETQEGTDVKLQCSVRHGEDTVVIVRESSEENNTNTTLDHRSESQAEHQIRILETHTLLTEVKQFPFPVQEICDNSFCCPIEEVPHEHAPGSQSLYESIIGPLRSTSPTLCTMSGVWTPERDKPGEKHLNIHNFTTSTYRALPN